MLQERDQLYLPNGDQARVDREKVTDYLLNLSHPDGCDKAAFFMRFGFTKTEWQEFAIAIKQHGTSNPVIRTVESPYGIRYIIDGKLETPDGRNPSIRTVWIMDPSLEAPRLVTAHPVKPENAQ